MTVILACGMDRRPVKGLATPKRAGACGRPPNKLIGIAASAPVGRWGSLVFGWRALRPPRVVFVLGCVSRYTIYIISISIYLLSLQEEERRE